MGENEATFGLVFTADATVTHADGTTDEVAPTEADEVSTDSFEAEIDESLFDSETETETKE